MKKIVVLFLTVISLQIFGENYKVTGNKLTQKELKTNNSGIEKEIKRFFTEEYLKIMKDELAKEKIENKEMQEIYFRFMNKYLSNLEYKIDEINYISDKKANVIVELKDINFESLDVERLLDEKNVDNKLIEKLFSKLDEKDIEEMNQLDEKEAEEIVVKKFLPYLTEVILEEMDKVKIYRTDKVEFDLNKVNGKWEITEEN